MTVRYASIWVLCASLLSLAGPFGTYGEYPYSLKFPYWLLIVSTSTFIGHVSLVACGKWLNPRKPLQLDAAASLMMAVLFTPILYVLTHAFLIAEGGTGPSLPYLLIYVLPVAFALYTVRRLLPGLDDGSYSFASNETHTPKLARRLPKTPDQPIIRLSSQDHLVEVVTGTESFRIRMRLSDAIDEMDGVDGFWTHRSHWVARNGMVDSERENGRTYIRLVNGDKVPVSRTYKPQLEEEGLL